MMMQDELNPLEKKHSRFIARVLRHHPEAIGIKLDKHGWADVEALLNGCKAHGHDIDRARLERIVELNDKKRFAFSEDGSMIRALQGHSIAVDVGLKKAIPPMKLYHGTVEQNAQSIAKKGLLPMKRLYVHLSPDAGTARSVGSRRKGKVIIYEIDTNAMLKDKLEFFQSENGVWLTKTVPVKYLKQMTDT